jgi:PQQ-dependent dehydrogenase (methanol/ethanol family)
MKHRTRTLVAVIAAMLAGLTTTAQVPNFKAVTDAMLQNPDPADWINWRRTLDGWGYSPLDQINRQNVHGIQLAWSWALNPGASQPTPLVYNGVMYIPNPGAGVQALDAVTGDLIWQFEKAYDASARSTGPMRSIAIYDDKIYVNTSDAHIVALSARTGAVVWDHEVADQKLGYEYTSGPIVAMGRVIAGMTGCTRYKNDVCFISAHDAQTGRELWRTSTVARPGEPGGDTWGDLPLMFRAGGDAWIPGSYDPKTNLIYWSTAQAKPWARAARGTDGDALYTNSTLALDPETGKIVWYHQFIPGETNDMDEVFESILIDHDGRSSLFKMGKLGILWELDRKTGQFVSAHELGYQNILTVDPRTGKTTYRPDAIPKIGIEANFCPSTAGFKSWRAMSYHPQTQAFYIPLNLTCETGVFGDVPRVEGRGGTGPVKRTNHFHPQSPNNLGEFLAMDMKSGKVLWRYQTRTPMNTAALTTGGGLAIVGDWDRYLYIFDVANGKVLFQTRMPTSLQGFPITYAVRGRQYLAIPVGTGGGSWTSLVPIDLTPEKQRPTNANAIYVFALPEGSASPAR